MDLQTVNKKIQYITLQYTILYYIIICPKNMNKTFVEKMIRTTALNIITIIIYDIVNIVFYNVNTKPKLTVYFNHQ